MHLRRALLLFAIVLGLAALATAASQPRQRDGDRRAAPQPREAQPTARELPKNPPLRLRLSDEGMPRTRSLPAGRAAELTVKVARPGLVEVRGLGLSADAEPLTPARFDLLVDRPGSYAVELVAAGSTERTRIGRLRVKPPT